MTWEIHVCNLHFSFARKMFSFLYLFIAHQIWWAMKIGRGPVFGLLHLERSEGSQMTPQIFPVSSLCKLVKIKWSSEGLRPVQPIQVSTSKKGQGSSNLKINSQASNPQNFKKKSRHKRLAVFVWAKAMLPCLLACLPACFLDVLAPCRPACFLDVLTPFFAPACFLDELACFPLPRSLCLLIANCSFCYVFASFLLIIQKLPYSNG